MIVHSFSLTKQVISPLKSNSLFNVIEVSLNELSEISQQLLFSGKPPYDYVPINVSLKHLESFLVDYVMGNSLKTLTVFSNSFYKYIKCTSIILCYLSGVLYLLTLMSFTFVQTEY